MKQAVLSLLLLVIVSGCANTGSVPVDDIYQQREALAEIWPGYDPVARGVGYYIPQDGQVMIAKKTMAASKHFIEHSPGVWHSVEPHSGLRSAYY